MRSERLTIQHTGGYLNPPSLPPSLLTSNHSVLVFEHCIFHVLFRLGLRHGRLQGLREGGREGGREG